MKQRDVTAADTRTLASAPAGRKRIAVIGIDRYRCWPVLNNAVCDAKGALRLFEHLGFELIGEPLFDDAATGVAIQALVTDDLMALGPDDSLVLFFAGHGGTRSHWLGGEQLKTGYLIPADAASGEKVATWIDLDHWLRKVARLPPRHILVILDACFAGIALSPVAKWRDSGTFPEASFASLQARRSRRIITSALDDQFAHDSGPVPGHSLFTGCLIEAFQHGQLGRGSGVTTGTEVGLYLQQRVRSYPESRQTPDFGTFEHDDRGEMVIPLVTEPFAPAVTMARPAETVSLAIATVPGPAGDAGGRNVVTRSRARWAVAALAFTSSVLGASFIVTSSFVAEPSVAAEPPVRTAEPRAPWVAPERDAVAASTEPQGTVREGSDPTGGSVTSATPPSGSGSPRSASGSSPASKPRVSLQRASVMSGHAATVPPSGNGAAAIAETRVRTPGAMAPNAFAPTASPPLTTEVAVPKRRLRAPPNRRIKPSVDERNCPVKGSEDVTIDSLPPGATIYLNHKECGELGKTPWKGKLPPSMGTATGRFTVIVERTGEPPVMEELTVLKSSRVQRLVVRMPPKP